MTINRCTCGARCHEAIKIPWIEPVIFSEFISWVYGYAILHYVPVDQQSLTLCKLWVLGAQLRCLRLQDDVIYFFAENISDLVLLNHGDLPLLPVETIQYVYTNTNYGNGLRRFLVDYTLYTMDKEVFEQTNFRHYHKDFEMELEVRNAEVHPKARRWEKLGKLLDGEHLQTYFVCKDRR
ncbi:hypothetical protein M501DRAFT_421736 [Patellaria atrata CBS 101060]|uniref:Uncharacterized protein n=1 Tax=Patellaria atrata CBS 101060 TaxID=1346257 RepID=A0A9P4SHA2_9PEZI|nr:hypothetical protein M501DRAFT_421736 [Patellaria atrata CBS 101060]